MTLAHVWRLGVASGQTVDLNMLDRAVERHHDHVHKLETSTYTCTARTDHYFVWAFDAEEKGCYVRGLAAPAACNETRKSVWRVGVSHLLNLSAPPMNNERRTLYTNISFHLSTAN